MSSQTLAAVCYASFAAKRRDYPARVIPGIFALASDAVMESPEALRGWVNDSLVLTVQRGLLQLRALHELARAGHYRRASQPCDLLQPPVVTLAQGAPCSGWAVVVGAALSMLGYAWRLATAGDTEDPYRHVYVQAFYGGRWFTLDCKGSQRGQDFDFDAARHRYSVVKYWRERTV